MLEIKFLAEHYYTWSRNTFALIFSIMITCKESIESSI